MTSDHVHDGRYYECETQLIEKQEIIHQVTSRLTESRQKHNRKFSKLISKRMKNIESIDSLGSRFK